MFGDVAGSIIQVVSNWELLVLAPPHEPGFVTVTVRQNGQEYSTIEQFGYGVTEPVLLPIAVDSLPGAGGARWSTEIWVHNDADHAVPIDREYCFFIGRYFPCGGEVRRIAAHSTMRLTGLGTANDPYARLFPPLQDAGFVHISIRVRDVSKDANGPATEIPAVRPRDLHSGRIVLPGIANDSRYRANLRVYSAAYSIVVSVADTTTGQVLSARTIGRYIPTDTDGFFPETIQDVLAAPALQGHERVDVIIETQPEDLGYWALLTLTDNATQQVMTFTPQ